MTPLPLKIVGAVILVATAALAAPLNWVVAMLVAFGLTNLILSRGGTRMVTAAGYLWTILALAFVHDESRGVATFLTWLIWPPLLLLSSTLSPRLRPYYAAVPEAALAARRAQATTAAVIVAVTLASVLYRLTLTHGLQQTAALFVGVPALLALVVTFSGPPKSATGVACKAVTLGMLVSMILLWEGMLCVVMSAPIFYAVAVAVGKVVDYSKDDDSGNPRTVVSCIAVLGLFGPMSLEGVTTVTTIGRQASVTRSATVHAAAADVERALFQTPRFERQLPMYLRAGFPRPIQTRIEEDGRGLVWIVAFRGGEMKLSGQEPAPGDLVLRLEERRPGYMRWRAQTDSSHMTHFLRWREAVVTWEPVGTRMTHVSWTLNYSRDLDPAWYFGPWEQYATGLAAEYLIGAVATP